MAEYRDAELTAVIGAMFGHDIVQDVYAIVPDQNGTLITEQKVRESIPRCWTDRPGVDFDTTDLIVTFVNGKSVRFTASEWASMQAE